MISLYAFGVEPPRVAQLMIYIDNKASTSLAWFEHHIQCKLTRQFDKAVIPGLGYDKDALDIGSYSSTSELLAHLTNPSCCLCQLFRQVASIRIAVIIF
jgi:hypothetical protein